MKKTAEIPFPLIDGLGFFTIFNIAADAEKIAVDMAEQNARDGVDGTSFDVFMRKDGKFLVTAIDAEDEVCYHIPAQMLREYAV